MKCNDMGLLVERDAKSIIAAAFNSIERKADVVGAQMFSPFNDEVALLLSGLCVFGGFQHAGATVPNRCQQNRAGTAQAVPMMY
ncbi:hypothetical protein WK55_22015 [Burkholderia ubonensis]|nr:hypothetical protein WK55_22015 [Burkholderia ubonensis]